MEITSCTDKKQIFILEPNIAGKGVVLIVQHDVTIITNLEHSPQGLTDKMLLF